METFSLTPLVNGFRLSATDYLINVKSGDIVEAKMFVIYVESGLAWPYKFLVAADNEQQAVDLVADFCDDNEMVCVLDDADLEESKDDPDMSVEEFAESKGMLSAGNRGIYIGVVGIEGPYETYNG